MPESPCCWLNPYSPHLRVRIAQHSDTQKKEKREKGFVALEILGMWVAGQNKKGGGGGTRRETLFFFTTSSPSSRTAGPPRCKYVVFCTLFSPLDAHF